MFGTPRFLAKGPRYSKHRAQGKRQRGSKTSSMRILAYVEGKDLSALFETEATSLAADAQVSSLDFFALLYTPSSRGGHCLASIDRALSCLHNRACGYGLVRQGERTTR